MALIQTEMNQVNSGGTSDIIVPNAIADTTNSVSKGLVLASNTSIGIVSDSSQNPNTDKSLPSIDVRYLLYDGQYVIDSTTSPHTITWSYNSTLPQSGDIVEIHYGSNFSNSGASVNRIFRATVGSLGNIGYDSCSVVTNVDSTYKTIANTTFITKIEPSQITFWIGECASTKVTSTSGSNVTSMGIEDAATTILYSVYLIRQKG